MTTLLRGARPRLLELFSFAGGSGYGYWQAGFDVVGIDLVQPSSYANGCGYFIQSDAFEYLERHWREFDAIHASPPCQGYSQCTPPEHKGDHPRLIPVVRDMLNATGKPFVIENVPGARKELHNPLMLCSSMFGLHMERHRYFELGGFDIWFTPPCRHMPEPVLITGTTRRRSGRFEYSVQECRDASGIQWMTRKELDNAVPPAYTNFIGEHLRRVA